MKKTISIIAAVAAIAGVFVFGYAAGNGQSSANAATTQSAALTTAITGSADPSATEIKQRYESFVADVATKAGVSTSTLDQAIRSVAVSRVQAAEKAGQIKPAVATKIENAIKNGTLGQLIQQRMQTLRSHAGSHPGLRLLGRFRRLAG